MVYRIYVEKKPQFAVDGGAVLADLNVALGIKTVENVRIINRYDCEKLPKENFEAAVPTVFSEPPVDEVYYELPKPAADERMFAVEFLPGQFDQRADSAAQCIQMLCPGERPVVKYAKIYVLKGKISDDEFARIKHYLINAVESRECGFDKYDTLEVKYTIPTSVETLTGFINKTDAELADFVVHYGLAMDNDDIKFCQDYFKSEHRDPTITEIRMIDTYWSDHCRHTTFGTIIDNADIKPSYIADTYAEYKADRHELGRDNKPLCLMDIATLAAKKLKKDGILKDLDESEEINACSVRIKVDVDGKDEDWLLMFKNETHNHPTEIEPFGGAATCLGGAIRDPLSGRSYVYQAMRVTGASDPLLPVEKTIKGKLPPRKITTTAAAGYSSYGNQIGLATGHVAEAQLSARLLLRTYAESARLPAILLSCSADVPAATAAAALPDLPRLTAYSPSTPAALRYRRVTLPRRESSRDYSEIPMLQSSSSAATTSAQAAFPLPSANLRTVWRST